MTECFLQDRADSYRCSYAELIADLNAGPHALPDYIYSSSTYEVFKCCILALLLERTITLLDSDFTQSELSQMLPDPRWREQSRQVQLNQPIRDLDELLQRLRAASAARIGFYTSGSTGTPRRVEHRLARLMASVQFAPKHRSAVWAMAYNPTHIAGFQVFLQAVLNGSTLVNVFGQGRAQVLAALQHCAVTHISATPTFYRLLLPLDQPLPGIQRVSFGGEALNDQLLEQMRLLFPAAQFRNIYALTEAGTVLVAQGEVFGIQPGLESQVRVEGGELYLHADLMGQLSAATALAQDWYATGDRVELVSESPLRFKLLERTHAWINVGGYKVDPSEVEAALCAYPGVSAARVYSKPNALLGQLICCDLVASGIDERALREYLNQHLQSFKIPRIIHYVDTFEQTRTGKLKRT